MLEEQIVSALVPHPAASVAARDQTSTPDFISVLPLRSAAGPPD